MYIDGFKDFEYKENISFKEIKKFFPSKDWDVGFLREDHFKKSSLNPLKTRGGFGQFAEDFSNHIYFRKLTNAIVLIRNGHTWDYTLYEQAQKILEESGLTDWYIVYTHYKEAAILSGLGVRARNSLIYSYKFGFDCHIMVVRWEKKIVNVPTNRRVNYNLWRRCKGCDDCAKACPAGAIHNEGDNPLTYWIDSSACMDFIQYSDHPTIPSIKKFWHENVYPEIPKDYIDRMTSQHASRKPLAELGLGQFEELPFNRNGYFFDGQVVKKDGTPIDVPVCRECTSQPRCSKWNGKYPYDIIGKNVNKNVIFLKEIK